MIDNPYEEEKKLNFAHAHTRNERENRTFIVIKLRLHAHTAMLVAIFLVILIAALFYNRCPCSIPCHSKTMPSLHSEDRQTDRPNRREPNWEGLRKDPKK